MRWSPGARVGRYEIVRELGRGGMGEVYLARDTQLERPVALKVELEGVHDPETEQRLRREAEVLARVEHPHLLRVFSCERIDGRTLIVSEFVEGETLADYVGRKGTLGASEAADLMRQAAEAVAAAHAAGVLHRDIKPENVMRAELGVKVMDFGLAFEAGAERLTQTGVSMGTPGYMPPESLQAGVPDPRSDVFGLGATLYFLLCGRAPFVGKTALQALEAAARGAFSGVRERAPAVPAWLAEVCERALAPDLEDRQDSAAAFAASLAAGPPAQSPWGLAGASVGLALVGVTALIVALAVRGDAKPAVPTRSEVAPSPSSVTVAPRRLDLPRAFGFSGWPEQELAKVLEAYEPWSISRSETGIRFLSRDPARPELAIPVFAGEDHPWQIEVSLGELRLEPGASMRLQLCSGQGWGARSVGLSLLGVAEGLELQLSYGRDCAAQARAVLDVDPRGPLRIVLQQREREVRAWVHRGGEPSLSLQLSLPEDVELPGGRSRLRLGSRQRPQLKSSHGGGHQRLNYSGALAGFAVYELAVRGRGIFLGTPDPGRDAETGRSHWQYVSGSRGSPVLLDGSRDGPSLQRLDGYVRALHEAREGRPEEAARQLAGLYLTTQEERDEAGLGADEQWHRARFFIRNRVLYDLCHYSPEFRQAIARAVWELVPPLEGALRTARDGRMPEHPTWWCHNDPVRHRSDWGWVQAALRLDPARDDVGALEILYRAKLYEEAWAKLEGRQPGVKRDFVLEGELAFGLGKFAEALRRWVQVPRDERERIPQAKLALARRYPTD